MDPELRRPITNYSLFMLAASLITLPYCGMTVLFSWLLTVVGLTVLGGLLTQHGRRKR